jgi:hypothetical protein
MHNANNIFKNHIQKTKQQAIKRKTLTYEATSGRSKTFKQKIIQS